MRVPDITLPEGLARLVTKLPAAPPSWLFVKGLNQLVRRRVVPAVRVQSARADAKSGNTWADSSRSRADTANLSDAG